MVSWGLLLMVIEPFHGGGWVLFMKTLHKIN
jgi:hypothetical protein